MMEGTLGIGTPVGWLGASAVVAPIRPLALHAGIGLGTQGWQFAAGARGRIPLVPRRSLDLGASWSTGAYAGVDGKVGSFGTAPIWYWRHAHQLNFELSLEFDQRLLVVRPFFGLGYVVNGADAVRADSLCATASNCSPSSKARLTPFFGVAIAFGVL